jgi:hypothetical protein
MIPPTRAEIPFRLWVPPRQPPSRQPKRAPSPLSYRRAVLFAKTHCRSDSTDEYCAHLWGEIIEMTRVFYENGQLYDLFEECDESLFD